MANIQIPTIHLPGIKSIYELPDEVIHDIYNFLGKQPNGIGISKFISSFTAKFDNEKLAGAIYSFGQLLAFSDNEIQEIADNLTESYKELAEDPLNQEQSNLLESRLYNILLNANFLIISNEIYHIFSHLNATTKTNITTDTRLLFNKNDFKSRDALLLHKLSIKFMYEGDMNSETFYLDTDDLLDLKSQIEESLLNEENIRKNNDGILNFIEP